MGNSQNKDTGRASSSGSSRGSPVTTLPPALVRGPRRTPPSYNSPSGLYTSSSYSDATVTELVDGGKLAPMSEPAQEPVDGLEECPICFLFYPSPLNRSTCCLKAICTECLLQVKPRNERNVMCPFCAMDQFGAVYIHDDEFLAALQQDDADTINRMVREKADAEWVELQESGRAHAVFELGRQAGDPGLTGDPLLDRRFTWADGETALSNLQAMRDQLERIDQARRATHEETAADADGLAARGASAASSAPLQAPARQAGAPVSVLRGLFGSHPSSAAAAAAASRSSPPSLSFLRRRTTSGAAPSRGPSASSAPTASASSWGAPVNQMHAEMLEDMMMMEAIRQSLSESSSAGQSADAASSAATVGAEPDSPTDPPAAAAPDDRPMRSTASAVPPALDVPADERGACRVHPCAYTHTHLLSIGTAS